MAEILRRKTPTVKIGQVRVGWEVPVVVQSMTNTDTADVAGTIEQVAALALAGSEIVRVTVNNEEAAAAVPQSLRAWTSAAFACRSWATSTTTATCC